MDPRFQRNAMLLSLWGSLALSAFIWTLARVLTPRDPKPMTSDEVFDFFAREKDALTHYPKKH